MLAMVVNDDAGHQTPHGVLRSIASMLAPTGTLPPLLTQSSTKASEPDNFSLSDQTTQALGLPD
jgi:predicted phage gp36 major capsid-like protein